MARRTGSGLCRSALWECFLDANVSFIGCSEMERETGSKFVSHNIVPIVQLDTTSTQPLS